MQLDGHLVQVIDGAGIKLPAFADWVKYCEDPEQTGDSSPGKIWFHAYPWTPNPLGPLASGQAEPIKGRRPGRRRALAPFEVRGEGSLRREAPGECRRHARTKVPCVPS